MISYGKIQNSYELDEEVYTNKMISIGELECGSVNTGDVISLHAERGDQAGCADQRLATHRI